MQVRKLEAENAALREDKARLDAGSRARSVSRNMRRNVLEKKQEERYVYHSRRD